MHEKIREARFMKFGEAKQEEESAAIREYVVDYESMRRSKNYIVKQ
jgi:hypothetical protein